MTYMKWAKALSFRRSKPGAAPVAAWLGHEVIGLHKGGFGFLLGQSVFTSTKVSYVSLAPVPTWLRSILSQDVWTLGNYVA
jgi:hypothetical protein